MANSTSRYFRTGRIIRGNDRWLVTQRAPDATAASDDIFHEVTGGETMQDIAYRYYDNAALWWVVGYWNGIVNPFLPLEDGAELRIPSPGHLLLRVLSR